MLQRSYYTDFKFFTALHDYKIEKYDRNKTVF
jgi:hypothetical protein